MEGWKETEVGKIPMNWEILLFPKFVILQRGKDLTKVNFKTGNVPVAGSNGIIGYHNTSFVKAPGVTVGRSGSCGRVCYHDTDFWAHNTSLYIKDFNGNDELFSYFYLQYLDVGRYKTGASVPTLDRNSLNTIKIPLPPLPEQRKIAHVLSTVQKAIEQQDKLIRTTTELKKALMQKLFTEGIRGESQKETEIGLVPERWEVVELEEVIDNSKGGGTPSTKKPEYWGGDIFWTTSKWLDENNIFLSDGEKRITKLGLEESSTNLLPENNLLISTRVTIGKIVINKIPIAYSQDLTGLWINKNNYDLRFLVYQIKNERIQNAFQSMKRGATIQGITREDLLKIIIVVPNIYEQMEIADNLESFDNKIEIHQKKKQILTALLKTLLHELMTGQLRVHELEF